MARTGVQSSEKAFRDVKVFDPESGVRLKYTGNGVTRRLRPVAVPGGDMMEGSEEDVERSFLGWVRKHCAYRFEYAKRKLDEGVDWFLLDGTLIEIKRVSNELEQQEIEGRAGFPREVLIKIAYEAMEVWKPFPISLCSEFLRTTFCFDDAGMLKQCSPTAKHRVLPSPVTSRIIRGETSLCSVDPLSSHRISFGIGNDNCCYVRVVLFGLLDFFVVVGELPSGSLVDDTLLHRFLVFDACGGCSPPAWEDYPADYDLTAINEGVRVQLLYYNARVQNQ
jgi:hypothetical protein